MIECAVEMVGKAVSFNAMLTFYTFAHSQTCSMNLRWKVAQAAEIRWWQKYLAKKQPENYRSWKMEYWQDLLSKIGVSPEKGATALDAGCGPAGIFMALRQQKVTAIDPLLEQYESKLEHFSRADFPNVHFQNVPLEAYSTETPFDIVFCLNAINHVADLPLSFDKLVNATRPGGQLVVSIDAHNYSWLKHVFRLLPGDILHPHQYDLEEYQAMLEGRNCTIEQTHLHRKEGIFNYYIIVARRAV